MILISSSNYYEILVTFRYLSPRKDPGTVPFNFEPWSDDDNNTNYISGNYKSIKHNYINETHIVLLENQRPTIQCAHMVELFQVSCYLVQRHRSVLKLQGFNKRLVYKYILFLELNKNISLISIESQYLYALFHRQNIKILTDF